MRRAVTAVAVAVAVVALAPFVAARAADLAPVTAPATAPAVNAADHYRAATKLLPKLNRRDDDWVLERTRPRTGPDADRIAGLLGPAVAELRRGAAVGRCDWGLDYTLGPALLIPDLNGSRALANAAVAHAEWLAANGKPDAALDDVEAVMALGRDVDDKVLVCHLVRIGIVEMAFDRAGGFLTRATPERLRRFQRALAALPPGPTPAESAAFEADMMLPWLRAVAATEGAAALTTNKTLASMAKYSSTRPAEQDELRQTWADPVRRDAAMAELAAAYAKAATDATLPDEDFVAARAHAQGDRPTAGPLVRMLVPSFNQVRLTDRRHRVRTVLVDAAVQVALDGPQAVADTDDPVGGGPFAYEQRGKGFVLASKMKTTRGETVVFVVGPPQQ